MELKFRNLTKDEIEVRVGGGKSLLLYKTARVDATILDETVGPDRWQKKFYQVKNTMICSVGILTDNGWVWKDDAGDDDYTMEKVKAEASDSFKRAAFAWGIGRNLYTAPKIKIPEQFSNSQFFDVEEIEYDKNNRISKLVISTNFGKDIVFSYPKTRNYSQNAQNTPKTTNTEVKEARGSIDKDDLTQIQLAIGHFSEQKREQFYAFIDARYGTMSLEALTLSQGKELVAKLFGVLK